MLANIVRPVPVCADESVHTRAGMADLRARYDAINIKLDKTGGLSEALALRAEARRLGFRVMIGCMVATSLAMAPAVLTRPGADWADLDGPLAAGARPTRSPHIDGAIHPSARVEFYGDECCAQPANTRRTALCASGDCWDIANLLERQRHWMDSMIDHQRQVQWRATHVSLLALALVGVFFVVLPALAPFWRQLRAALSAGVSAGLGRQRRRSRSR